MSRRTTVKTENFLVLIVLAVLVFTGCSGRREHRQAVREEQLKKAAVLYNQGDRETALIILEELCGGRTFDGDAEKLYARTLYFSGNRDKAAKVWEKLASRSEEDIDCIKYLSRIYLNTGRSREADSLLDRGLARSGRDPELHYLKALSLREEGDLEEALVYLEQASLLMETRYEIYLELAEIYSFYGYPEKSREILGKCRALISPGHPLEKGLNSLETQMEESL